MYTLGVHKNNVAALEELLPVRNGVKIGAWVYYTLSPALYALILVKYTPQAGLFGSTTPMGIWFAPKRSKSFWFDSLIDYNRVVELLS